MKSENLLGRLVQITDKESSWYSFYGYVVYYDGEYHVSGGCISSNDTLEIAPVFDRDQFVVIRKLTDKWRKLGVHTLLLDLKN